MNNPIFKRGNTFYCITISFAISTKQLYFRQTFRLRPNQKPFDSNRLSLVLQLRAQCVHGHAGGQICGQCRLELAEQTPPGELSEHFVRDVPVPGEQVGEQILHPNRPAQVPIAMLLLAAVCYGRRFAFFVCSFSV